MKTILRAQTAYYVGTGLLPLISMRLFEAITGKKTDRWLVQMVGFLATSIGITLGVATRSSEIDAAIPLLSVSAALSFAGIDIAYVAKRRISPVYLGDAAVELAIAAIVLKSLVAGDDD